MRADKGAGVAHYIDIVMRFAARLCILLACFLATTTPTLDTASDAANDADALKYGRSELMTSSPRKHIKRPSASVLIYESFARLVRLSSVTPSAASCRRSARASTLATGGDITRKIPPQRMASRRHARRRRHIARQI